MRGRGGGESQRQNTYAGERKWRKPEAEHPWGGEEVEEPEVEHLWGGEGARGDALALHWGTIEAKLNGTHFLHQARMGIFEPCLKYTPM